MTVEIYQRECTFRRVMSTIESLRKRLQTSRSRIFQAISTVDYPAPFNCRITATRLSYGNSCGDAPSTENSIRPLELTPFFIFYSRGKRFSFETIIAEDIDANFSSSFFFFLSLVTRRVSRPIFRFSFIFSLREKYFD